MNFNLLPSGAVEKYLPYHREIADVWAQMMPQPSVTKGARLKGADSAFIQCVMLLCDTAWAPVWKGAVNWFHVSLFMCCSVMESWQVTKLGCKILFYGQGLVSEIKSSTHNNNNNHHTVSYMIRKLFKSKLHTFPFPCKNCKEMKRGSDGVRQVRGVLRVLWADAFRKLSAEGGQRQRHNIESNKSLNLFRAVFPNPGSELLYFNISPFLERLLKY